MNKKYFKIVKAVDFTCLSLWTLYCAIRSFFPSLEWYMQKLVVPATVILLLDGLIIWGLRIYKPIENHIKEEILRFSIVSIPVLIIVVQTALTTRVPLSS